MRMETPTARLIQPDGWRPPRGYSNGVKVSAHADLVFVAGQIGWRPDTGELAGEGLVAQFEQALANCVRVVVAAGGGAQDIVRMTVFCTSRREYLGCQAELSSAWRRVMGRHYPAMSLLEVAALVEAGAVVEVEATAAVSRHSGGGG